MCGYTGVPFPAWADDPSRKTWVPVPAFKARLNRRPAHSRTQIPLVAAHALCKGHGLDLEKVYAFLPQDRNICNTPPNHIYM